MNARKALLRRIKERLEVREDELLSDIAEFLKKSMTVFEAGTIGGNKVKQTRGLEFYTEIGMAGGIETKRRYGTDHYHRIGALGGRSKKTKE